MKRLNVDLYARKKRWKIVLSVVALLIVCFSMYYTNNLVKRFAAQEEKQMKMWAEAVQNHAELMNYTELFFNEVSNQENKRVELLAMAYRRFLAATSDHMMMHFCLNTELVFFFQLLEQRLLQQLYQCIII